MASLHKALEEGSFHKACVLITKGANLDYQDKNGQSALMKSVLLNNRSWSVRLFKQMHEKGVRLDLFDNAHKTVLFHAAENGRASIVRMLLDNPEVSLSEKDSSGQTALHVSASKGYSTVVRILVSFMTRYDLGVDVVDVDGMTALMLACQNGHLKAAQVLMNEGAASLTMRDNVHFRNAHDWLRSAHQVDKASLRESLKLLASANDNNSAGEIEKAAKQKRAKSAPQFSAMSKRLLAQRPRTANAQCMNNTHVQCMNNVDNGCVPEDQTLLSHSPLRSAQTSWETMFELYAAHTSPSFRPGAQLPPDYQAEVRVEEDVQNETKTGKQSLTTKLKLQRLLLQKRPDSVLQRLRFGTLRRPSTSANSISENVLHVFRRHVKSEPVRPTSRATSSASVSTPLGKQKIHTRCLSVGSTPLLESKNGLGRRDSNRSSQRDSTKSLSRSSSTADEVFLREETCVG